MIVYAVKNKDGKYDMDCCDVNGNELFSSDISMSNWIYSEEDAKEFLYGYRVEIVPVTICEGDLEKENKQLKEQLVRKDQFIKMLQEDNRDLRKGLNRDALNYAIERANTIRREVCDEIREKLKAHCDYTDEDSIGWYLTEHKVDMLLDQIEKNKEGTK